jgi:hypothetical protein
MEVHHAHHPNHKKKISEYLLEFFMLFFAVTLGFFAENYREHSIIEHRMQENYAAIIVDLEQDNLKIDSIFTEAKNGINLITLSHVLYKYKTRDFTEKELMDSIYNIKGIPSYTTLFVNNTTFKNMQSSGLLSYVTDKDLKTGLSYYYEVLFKKLNDNNKLFDDVGINYLDKFLIFSHGSGSRKWLADMYQEVSRDDNDENGFADPKQYRKFLMGLTSAKSIFTSDDFVIATNVYITRYFGYQRILYTVKANNNKLILQLKAQLEH